jgi:hypothetical protein
VDGFFILVNGALFWLIFEQIGGMTYTRAGYTPAQIRRK